MIIMPGETKTITWPLEEVPPPKTAPVQDRARELGLPDGLKVETPRDSRQWRCCSCSRMQRPNSEQVWVPDGVLPGDPAWSVTETCRQNAYNGNYSAWCLKCAKSLGGVANAVSTSIEGRMTGLLAVILVVLALATLFLAVR